MYDLYHGAWVDQRVFHGYTMVGSYTIVAKGVNATPLHDIKLKK